jgi:DNA-binding XRE family transcriptional regulator
MSVAVKIGKRRGRRPPEALSRPDFPYTMRLPDGRTVCIEVPGRWVSAERGGEPAFLPQAVALLDRVRAVFMSALDQSPSPGYLVRLREGLGLTQQQFGERVGVDKMTVSRWERGAMRPGAQALRAIEKLRRTSVRGGVALSS